MGCRKEYQGEPLAMEADAEAEDADEEMEVLVSVEEGTSSNHDCTGANAMHQNTLDACGAVMPALNCELCDSATHAVMQGTFTACPACHGHQQHISPP